MYVFATDNEVHMGEHRYVVPRGSKSTPYQESASTPLIIRGPVANHNVLRKQLVANSYDSSAPPSGLASRLHRLADCAAETCHAAEDGTQ